MGVRSLRKFCGDFAYIVRLLTRIRKAADLVRWTMLYLRRGHHQQCGVGGRIHMFVYRSCFISQPLLVAEPCYVFYVLLCAWYDTFVSYDKNRGGRYCVAQVVGIPEHYHSRPTPPLEHFEMHPSSVPSAFMSPIRSFASPVYRRADGDRSIVLFELIWSSAMKQHDNLRAT